MARGASRYEDLGAVSTSWQIDGTGDFNGSGEDGILWRNRRTATSSSGTRMARGASRTRDWAPSTPAGRSPEPAISTASGEDGILWRNREWRCRALEREWLGGLHRPRLGRRQLQLADRGNRRFQRQRRRRHPVAQREWRCRALEPEWLGGLHLSRTWAPSNSNWQIAGTGDFTGKRRRRHPVAQRATAMSSSGTRTARGASPTRTWASSAPVGRSGTPATSPAAARTASSVAQLVKRGCRAL